MVVSKFERNLFHHVLKNNLHFVENLGNNNLKDDWRV